MKIKTLLLSSVVATGLSTGAMAADLGVLTSFDVCDELGITGLTISSDTNCLQISGAVSYEFNWGDNNGTVGGGYLHAPEDNLGVSPLHQDWSSEVEAFLKFVGTADSDFGPASATIKLDFADNATWVDGANTATNANVVVVDEAYVSIGNSTVIMAGKKDSIANTDGDVAYNWLGLEHDDDDNNMELLPATGGHVIQLISTLGDSVDVGIALENLQGQGTVVGVMNYFGDNVVAHLTVAGNGATGVWAGHAGVEVTADVYKFLVAATFDNATPTNNWGVVASAQATFDMFTLAASVAAADGDDLELAASATAAVTDTVTVKLGVQWDDHDTTVTLNEQWKVALGLSAEVTETITINAEVGAIGENTAPASSITYGEVGLVWNPGGGYSSSVTAGGNSAGAYTLTYTAAKSF